MWYLIWNLEFNLDVGNGKIPCNPNLEEGMIKIPNGMESNQDSLKEFCQEIFPNLGEKIKHGMKNMDLDDDWNKFVHNRAIICPLNKDVDEVNNICLGLMEGDSATFFR